MSSNITAARSLVPFGQPHCFGGGLAATVALLAAIPMLRYGSRTTDRGQGKEETGPDAAEDIDTWLNDAFSRFDGRKREVKQLRSDVKQKLEELIRLRAA